MNTIVVLAGGISNERAVSLRSGSAVAAALQAKGHTATILDPGSELEKLGNPDAVFPALHGQGGEDGTIQATLETAGIPYVGSGVAASALCSDKWLYRQILQAGSLPVAAGELVTANSVWRSPLSSKPFVLKPIQGGSSLDTYIIRDLAVLNKPQLEESLRKYGVMLLEELILGVELTAGILDNQPLPVVEIIPPIDGDFDYENKYNGKTQELCPAQHVGATVQKQAQQLALQVHRLTGCRDLSRTDIMAAPDGRLIILETNTMPGMTDQSLFPKAAAAASIAMPDLIDRLVQMSLDFSHNSPRRQNHFMAVCRDSY